MALVLSVVIALVLSISVSTALILMSAITEDNIQLSGLATFSLLSGLIASVSILSISKVLTSSFVKKDFTGSLLTMKLYRASTCSPESSSYLGAVESLLKPFVKRASLS